MAEADRRRWWLLGAMSGVLGLIVLDETIVAVSLPVMSAELGLSVAGAHWVVNAYLLSFTCAVAIAGRFGDHFSKRPYFATGAVVFALASLAAALAQSGAMLIAARALQGVAAAMIFPTSIALITAAFPPKERGTAFGYQTTVGGIFMSSGPLVGGLLTEMVSWRMIFWVGIPVVLAIAALLWRIWSPAYDSRGAAGRLEALGPIALVLGLFGLVTAVMQGPDWGWETVQVLGLMAVGLALLALFTWRELTHPAPLLDLSLLGIPEVRGGVLIFALFQLEKITMFVFIAQVFQTRMGLSPVLSGLAVSLAILPTLGTSVLIGTAADRHGARYVINRGVTLHGAAILAFALTVPHESYVLSLVPLLLWGATMPSIAIPSRRVMMNAAPADKQGQTSGMNLTVQMLGGCLGLALCGALLAGTGSYVLLFCAIGLATLAIVPIAALCFARG